MPPRSIKPRARNWAWEHLGLTPSRLRRGACLLFTTVLIFALLMARLRPEAVSYQVGDRATRTIKAPRAASYVDEVATEQLRQDAAAAVQPVYTRDADAQARALQALHERFALARSVRENPDISDRKEALRQRLDIQLSPEAQRVLLEGSDLALERVERMAAEMVREAMRVPLRSHTQDVAQAQERIAEQSQALGLSEPYRLLLVEMAQAALQPNLLYDAEATEAKREEARQKVPEVRRQLQPGDVVISRDEIVTERHIAMFKALGLQQPSVDYLQALSLLGVLFVLTAATSLLLRRFAREIWDNAQQMAIICGTFITVAAFFSVLRGFSLFEVVGYSLASAAAVFLALTITPFAGSVSCLYLGALVSLASPATDARPLLVGTLAALLASHSVRARESRSSTITRAALLVAVSNTVLALLGSHVFGFLINTRELGLTAAGGFLAVIFAAGLLSVIERPLGLTTPLRLLELQNPNEPLLKRLLTEAPGTYQSSVMVANLAEPAAAAVGADPILTRTACLYHDIGKLTRPYFFVENQFGAENPHERLSPHLSALVLISHVKEGLELAEEMKLPPIVASVIPQHHGTSLVSFMYQRAQAEAGADAKVKESNFRYPGPKPQTKENAIIMLADTVEAAARTLTEPTEERIKELVEQLIDARIEDEQLDEAPLTFQDIKRIKEIFVNTLKGMFHQRLAYPSNDAAAAREAPKGEQKKVAH